ncbi:MAG: hypothetical protein GC161_18370 [Planctomycetaceae bacterium]|nr:hypothetical protein [Planctomycetaceae bacterium]
MKRTRGPKPQLNDTRLPLLYRRADVVEGTFDESTRTVDICWSTGARGLNIYFGEEIVDAAGKRLERPEAWSLIEEELSLDEGHVRLEELQAHGPFLDGHRSHGGLDAILGSIPRAWVEKGKAYATVRARPGVRGDEVIAGLRSGDLRSFSAGYRVRRFLDVTPPNAKVRRLRAIDWTPKEVSIVPIPFDKGVGLRAEGPDLETCLIVRGDGQPNMEEELDENGNPITPASTRSEGGNAPAAPAAGTSTPAPAPAPRQRSEADIARAERERIALVDGFTARHELGEEFRTRAIDGNWDAPRIRKEVLDVLQLRDSATPVGQPHMAHVGSSGAARCREAVEDLLMHRLDPKHKLDKGISMRGASLLYMGAELLRSRGARVDTLNGSRLAGQILGLSQRGGSSATMTTSDFPEILANVANKGLLKMYQEAEETFSTWTTRGMNPDFKPNKRVRLSDAPGLLEKVETAKYERGAMGEQAESLSVKTFGRMVGVSREAMINDDLSLFTRVLAAMGRRARQLEGDLVYTELQSNPVMSDTNALFHASHGNLGSGVIGAVGLAAGFTAMRKQKAPNGTRLNLRPSTIIVPAVLEYTARKELLEAIVPTKTSDANPFRGMLQIVVDSRLDDVDPAAWYLAASPALVDTIEIATLNGFTEPHLEEDWEFDSESIWWKVRHDVGVKALDWLGLYKSTGS